FRRTGRHGDDRRFLEGEHVAQLVLARERVHQRQLGRPRIAEQDLYAFLLQQLEESALSGHDGQCGSPDLLDGRRLCWAPSPAMRSHLRSVSTARITAPTARSSGSAEAERPAEVPSRSACERFWIIFHLPSRRSTVSRSPTMARVMPWINSAG